MLDKSTPTGADRQRCALPTHGACEAEPTQTSLINTLFFIPHTQHAARSTTVRPKVRSLDLQILNNGFHSLHALAVGPLAVGNALTVGTTRAAGGTLGTLALGLGHGTMQPERSIQKETSKFNETINVFLH